MVQTITLGNANVFDATRITVGDDDLGEARIALTLPADTGARP